MISLGQISYFAALDDLWCHLKFNTLTWVFQHISSICAGVVQYTNNTYLLSDNHTFEPHYTVTSSCSFIWSQYNNVHLVWICWVVSLQCSHMKWRAKRSLSTAQCPGLCGSAVTASKKLLCVEKTKWIKKVFRFTSWCHWVLGHVISVSAHRGGGRVRWWSSGRGEFGACVLCCVTSPSAAPLQGYSTAEPPASWAHWQCV